MRTFRICATPCLHNSREHLSFSKDWTTVNMVVFPLDMSLSWSNFMGQLMFANKSFGLLKELAIDSEFITNPSMKSNEQKMISLCRKFKGKEKT